MTVFVRTPRRGLGPGGTPRRLAMRRCVGWHRRSAYLQALPAAAVFIVFFALPIVLVVVVSFFGYETYQMLIPDFTLENYREVFSEAVTYRDLSDDARSSAPSSGRSRWCSVFCSPISSLSRCAAATWQMVLLLICTIPFWTSIMIRMIAWIPLLGRNGLVNQLLVGTHSPAPQEWLLYSEFT